MADMPGITGELSTSMVDWTPAVLVAIARLSIGQGACRGYRRQGTVHQ